MKQINKIVQVHEECACGYNIVYPQSYPVKWSDIKACGIKRRKDRITGNYFLTKSVVIEKCLGEHYDDDF